MLRPTQAGERIDTLDIARGIALFGIFMVNIQLMTKPLAYLWTGDPAAEGPAAAGFHYVTRVMFESKSYPLFSMLFGMGMALMLDRARAAGRPFVAPYLRRTAQLLMVGLVHALLIWYGDILVYYASFAVVVMWFAGLSTRVLLSVAGGLLGLASLWIVGVSLLGGLLGGGEVPEATSVTTFSGFWEALSQGQLKGGPVDPAWAAAEVDANKNGPFLHAVAMRAINWGSGTVFWFLFSGTFLHVPAMFFLGAAIMRSGVLTNPESSWPKRFVHIGLFVGVPGSAVAVAMSELTGEDSIWFGLSGALTFVVGPCVSIGYLGVASWLALRLRSALVVRSIAAAGRMAMTNYLGQSIIVAALAQHWGLGWYDEVSRVGMVGIVAVIYAGQLVFSSLWLSRFTMGPLEYLWRCGTYFRLPRLLKQADS